MSSRRCCALSEYPSPEPTPLRLTSRGVAAAIVVALFAAAAAVARIGVLPAAFAAGLGVLALLLYWRVYGAARAGAVSRLRVERRVVGEPVEGRRLRVEVVVENPTPIPIEHLEVYDEPPRLWRLGGQPRAVLALPAFSRAVLVYEAVPVYGLHRFGPVRLVAYDPLGLFRAESTHPEASAEYRVAPRLLEEVRGYYLVPSSPRPGGVAPSRQKGVGTVFYDVREYVPGDDIRLVYWKGFARTGRLTVKEYEQEVQIYTMLVFDATPTMFRGVLGETKVENIARVVHTVLRYAAERGDNYRLVLIAPDASITHTPWLRGRGGLARAVETLSSLEWVVGDAEPRLEDRLAALRRLASLAAREKTLIFLFTDTLEDPKAASLYAGELAKLRLLRHEVEALIPLTAYYEAEELARRDETLAKLYALAALERLKAYREILRAFRSRGIPVVATGPVQLASTVLRTLEEYRRMMV